MSPEMDQNENSTVSVCFDDIVRLKAAVRGHHAQFEELMVRSELSRSERRKRILKIGRKLDRHRKAKLDSINRNMASLQHSIRCRYSSRWNIETEDSCNAAQIGAICYELQRSFVFEAEGD